MNFWEPCWACRLISGEHCGELVIETPDVVVAINPFATNPRHALIMPPQHIVNIYEPPDAVAGPILSMAARVARAAKAALGGGGITLRQNNDPASDQHLFHFHLHVIPRHEGDRERFIADAPLASPEAQAEMAARLRAAI